MPSPQPRTATPPLPKAPIQKPVGSESRSGEKVTVACKLPHGLLLRNFEMVERSELVMGGGTRTVKVAQQVGEIIRIRGVSVPLGVQLSYIVGGWALTPNVDKDAFDRWMHDNKQHDAVINGQIFAADSPHVAADQAKEKAGVKSNLEPINPDPAAKDPRMIKGVKTIVKEDA